MGTIVINQTDCKQNVVLQSSLDGITGGYYDAAGVWHDLGVSLDPLLELYEIGSVTKTITGQYAGKVYKYEGTNRIRMPLPVINKAYTIKVIDESAYDIVGFGLTSLDYEYSKISASDYSINFPGDSIMEVTWVKTFSSTEDYIWFALRKTDNSDFTSAELENVVGTIITITPGE